MIRISLALLAALFLAPAAGAQDRTSIGYGRLVTNDLIGDGQDRWQTGSIASSRVRGPYWQGQLPQTPFELLEYRLGAQIMAPANLTAPAEPDRPYAGALSVGLHTHFDARGFDMSMGGDLVVTGPQTGLSAFQTALHDALDIAPASGAVKDGQVGNRVHPTLVAEAARDLSFGPLDLRPFAELRWGAETLARAGLDLRFGPLGEGELWVRDPVTGQRYRTVLQDGAGLGVVFGADVARVTDSVLLPERGGLEREDLRSRVRAGLHWQGETASAFYGLTWLSEEFEGQPEGQVLGSVRLKLAF